MKDRLPFCAIYPANSVCFLKYFSLSLFLCCPFLPRPIASGQRQRDGLLFPEQPLSPFFDADGLHSPLHRQEPGKRPRAACRNFLGISDFIS